MFFDLPQLPITSTTYLFLTFALTNFLVKKHQKLKKGINSIFITFRKFILTIFTKIDATGTKMNFFEFWFFCWVTKSTYYERLRRFLRLLKKISLQLQLYVKWKSYAIGKSSFDKLCKNCRYSHKNQFFCVLIFSRPYDNIGFG